MKMKINNILMNYELSGSGKTLTLVHGLGDNLNIWYNQIHTFAQYFRVLAYDIRGHGKSELSEEKITINTLVNDLACLLKALDIKETLLLGHSLGGRIALQFTIKYPEIVQALILCNSVGSGPDVKEVQNMIRTAEKDGVEGIIKERINQTFTAKFTKSHPEIIDRYKLNLQQVNVAGFLRFIQPLAQPERRVDRATNVEKIKCPTLIIVGKYDPVSGATEGREYQKLINGSQLKILSTGHFPAVEQPDKFNETVLTFLNA